MLKINKFISLILLSNILVIGCERIDNFDEGKAFINAIKDNLESNYKFVTSFGLTNNKYSLMSEYGYSAVSFSKPYYTSSYEYNVRKNACSYYMYDEGLEYDYTLVYDEYYYEYYNLCDTYYVCDSLEDSSVYWSNVIDSVNEGKNACLEFSILVLEGILELIEGNVESSYNLDYEIEFFKDGAFNMVISASGKSHSKYYEVKFNNYLLSYYSETYKKGLTFDKEEVIYAYDSNLNVPLSSSYSKEDNNNLKGTFINSYLDKVKSNVLGNCDLSSIESFNVDYSKTVYENGVKNVEYDMFSLDINGNMKIYNDHKNIYIIKNSDTYYLYDVDKLIYDEIDQSEYASYYNKILLDYKAYQGYLGAVLNGLSSNEEVVYYSNKPFDLDLKYSNDEYAVNMTIDNYLLTYLYVNEFDNSKDTYIVLSMNDSYYFEMIDFSDYQKK